MMLSGCLLCEVVSIYFPSLSDKTVIHSSSLIMDAFEELVDIVWPFHVL